MRSTGCCCAIRRHRSADPTPPGPPAAAATAWLSIQLRDLYRACNGLSIFAGSLSFWGLRGHFVRDSSARFQPFDLAAHHDEWSGAAKRRRGGVREGTVFIGSYSWDGSEIYVVGDLPQVHRSPKGDAEPLNTWPDITSFLAAEYDRLAFHGKTVAELRREFVGAVKDYVADCKEQGLSSEKPASGKLLIRVPPEVHSRALIKAQAMGQSLNQWATEALEQAVQVNGQQAAASD